MMECSTVNFKNQRGKTGIAHLSAMEGQPSFQPMRSFQLLPQTAQSTTGKLLCGLVLLEVELVAVS